MHRKRNNIFTLIILFCLAQTVVAQKINLFLNGDTVPVKKIECWSFSKMSIAFDYNSKMTDADVVGLAVIIGNRYSDLVFLKELDLKAVKKEGKKNKKVFADIFKNDDPREETGFVKLFSQLKLTRGIMYYEPDEKGDDSTWLSFAVVKGKDMFPVAGDSRKKKREKEDEEEDMKEEDEKETNDKDRIWLYDVALRSEKILMLNRSAISDREWMNGADIPYPAGNCPGLKLNTSFNGEWTRKNDAGQIVVKGNYQDGLRNGTWIQLTEDGKYLKEIRHYDKGSLNGSYKRYNEKGMIEEQGAYVNGKRQGTWFTFEDNAEPKYIWEYDNGLLLGAPREYGREEYWSGKKKKGKEEGLWLRYDWYMYDSTWYANGLRNGEGFRYEKGIIVYHCNFLDGREDGRTLKFNDKGMLTTDKVYKDHQLTGMSREYENGCLKYEGMLENGKRTGLWREYNCSKNFLVSEVIYVNDKREGPYKEFHENGALREEGTYLNDFENGPCKKYWDNGKLQEEGVYKNGRNVGVWKFYFNDGSFDSERKFSD